MFCISSEPDANYTTKRFQVTFDVGQLNSTAMDVRLVK